MQMSGRLRCALAALLLVVLVLVPAARADTARARAAAAHSLRAPVTGERFYFVMADRFENGRTDNDHGGLPPGKGAGQSGFDPTGTGWYHGGDLAGLTERIDYIRGLGTTAIWLTPSFKNKAVQPQDNSAGYHGYWITDFTQIDPHLGTNDELRALVDAAHRRGMKVFFDIITNHTADVIGYEGGQRLGYTSKDRRPYTTAVEAPFDDRDFAGTDSFPALDPLVSFPYVPVVPADEREVKVPAWLNDPVHYHNRGDTTFTGEDALYGDFFGLDDLFTEQPAVEQGMEDIYKAWIGDFGIDGFRIDTMKHVNDEFWQRFAPDVLAYARAQGKREFFLFGEVFDTTKTFTSHFTTQDRVQAVLDFPFQAAAQGFAAGSAPASSLQDFFTGDDWYTDADSNAYQLPTFLGNHDMGRIGLFINQANPGAPDAERVARDRLAHELMYLSRGNPVVYYGDEQGFTGDGGDQGARQDMFPSQVASYNDDDLIGTDATTAQSNFDPAHVLYRSIADLAALTRRHPALRDGAQQHRSASSGPGVYAFSRLDRRDGHEYVVALNNAESVQSASVPTWIARGRFERLYGTGGGARATTGADRRLGVTVPALSAVVYRSKEEIPESRRAPSIALTAPPEGRDRLEVRADVGGSSFYEVTFEAQAGDGPWQRIGTDDNAPYRVFHDVAALAPGTLVRYRATVLDNDRHTRTSAVASSRVAEPQVALEAPNDGGRVRGEVEVRATAVPERSHYVVTVERSVDGGPFTPVSTDDSSPVYTAFDDTADLADGAKVSYRAVLTYAPGRTVTSATRTVTVVRTPVTTAIVHYHRPAGDYLDWGLHLFCDAIAPGVATDWGAPRQRAGLDAFGAVFEVPLRDDTKRLSFIVHRPLGDTVPDTREPGGDRSFVPLEHPEIWLKAGDPAIYFAPPPTG
jgi:alpha-amylase